MTNPQRRSRNPIKRALAKPSPIPEIAESKDMDHCYVISGGQVAYEASDYDEALAHLKEKRAEDSAAFVWLSLWEPTDQRMQDIAKAFRLHDLIVEDAVKARQRPKVERYDDQLFLVVRSVKYSEFDVAKTNICSSRQVIETGEIHILIGRDFIITIRHNTSMPELLGAFDVSNNPQMSSPASIAWAVSDALVDQYVSIAAELSGDVDELEEEVFTPGASINVDQIYLLKREVLEMRHSVDPLEPAVRALVTDNKDILDKQLRSYFRDVHDHESRARDELLSSDERLTSLIDAAVAKISLQQNSDMRKISALVGMAAVPTLVAGIYGMNFENMPELYAEHGYYVVLFVMFLTVVALWIWFRRNNWL